MELHIPPQYLYEQMFRLRTLDTPRLERLWATYGESPRRLTRAVRLLRQMNGFGQADAFYDGVGLNESFERDYQPVATGSPYTPVMLILILDLYFRLTPLTMVPDTPEVQELARLLKLRPAEIAEVMDVFQFCDPYLNRDDIMIHPLLVPCQEIWQRFGNESPERLAALAGQLKAYFV